MSPEPECCCAIGQFGDLCVLVGLAGLRTYRADHAVGVVHHPSLHSLQNLSAAVEAECFPSWLRGSAPTGELGDFLRRHVGHVPDHVAGGWILDLALCSPLVTVGRSFGCSAYHFGLLCVCRPAVARLSPGCYAFTGMSMSRLRILPGGPLGSSSTNQIRRGYL